MKYAKLETPYKPAIAREGIIMVLAPVLLSTGLLLWVGLAWIEEGQIASKCRKDFEATAHGAKAMTLLGKAMAVRLRRATASDIARDNLTLANKEIELCKAATRESEIPQSALPIIDRLARLGGEEASVSRPMTFTVNTATVTDLMDVRRSFNRYAAILEVSQSLEEIIDAELLKKWASQDKALAELRRALLLFLGSILAMALLLTGRFLRSIVSRLNTLLSNTQLVGRRDRDLSVVSGTDELAYLNSILVAADGQLKKAEDDRKSILEMVAHDMRSPLMASQISLQIVDELTEESLPEQPRKQLLLAQGNLQAVLGFIENLLAVEKFESEFSSRAKTKPESDSEQTADDTELMSFQPRRGLFAFHQLRIAEKVLAIVLLPLAIQAAMLVSIAMGILNTERLDNIGRSKNRIATSALYGADCLLLAEGRKVKYALTGDTKYEQLATDDLAKYRKWIKDAYKYITDPMDRTNFDATNSKFLLEMNRMERYTVEPINVDGDPMAGLKRVMKPMDSGADPMLLQENEEGVTHKSKLDEMALADSLEKERNQRDSVQRNIYLFLPINIAIAFLLIIVFTRGVARRLDIIVEHAKQLPKRKPIVYTVSGHDELNYLDLILQKTCANLIESEEHRSAIMQMIAHDMREPMIATQSAIELLGALPADVMPQMGRKNLLAAEKNINRILHLLNDLFTLDSLEAGKLELDLTTADVKEIADEAISALAAVAATRGISLTNSCQSDCIDVDAARIHQVLINFISNAIKFSPDNSVITLVSKQAPGSVAIGVKDQGPGMNKGTASRVFDKFFQAEGKKKSEGFGLGLAICKLIVESHGGSVFVETAPGKGATFWIRLPRD
jgi:signal transduction histidine kinase